MRHVLMVNCADNVANALDDIQDGEEFSYSSETGPQVLKAIGNTKFGFKVAVKPIAPAEKIIKYGCVIGTASTAIQPGECVHIHNVEGTRGRGDKGGM